jgi:DNA anti-recombination protein RmuC
MVRPVDSSDLDRFGADLRQEMAVMGADLRQEIHTTIEQVRTELRQEIRDGDRETRRYMEVLHAQLLERMDATAAETRRHFGVVSESLRSDIKTVAEGVGALDEKVERFRGEVNQEFAKVDRRFLHLQVRAIERPDPA